MGLAEGVGLLVLIPLLQLVGLDAQQGSLGTVMTTFRTLFGAVGLEPTLPTVLGLYVVIVAARATTSASMFSAWPVQQYPYLVVNLDLPASGEGTGELIAAARFRARRDGRVELDNPGFLSSRLLAVRRLGG